MNRKQRWIQTAAFVFMLATTLLIIPAVMLDPVVGLLFDAPGSGNNVPLVALAYGWFSLPLFFGFAAFRSLKVVMSPDSQGFLVAMAVGLAPIVYVIVCGYVLWG